MFFILSVKRGLTFRSWPYFCKIVILVSLVNLIILFVVKNKVFYKLTNKQHTDKFQSTETTDGIFLSELSHQVEIYNRASIGEYFWNHVIEGKKELMPNGILKKGFKIVEGLNFTYVTDVKYQTGNLKALPTSENVVLIVDGSSIPNQKETESWMKRVLLLHAPKTLFLVILCDKDCRNRWIIPYLVSNGGPVNAVFITGDSVTIDRKEIFPWTLGVATQLDFPLFLADEIDILSQRAFVCNFIGTIRPNSSREAIPKLFQELDLGDMCFLKASNTSISNLETLGEYIQILSDSDLTICPASDVGNPETHCIYEAFSLGSVPVVEDKESCGGEALILLKKYKAPMLLVKSLENGLGGVIDLEKKMNLQEKIARRATVINWYADFRHHLAKEFIHVVRSHINPTEEK